MSNSSYIVKCSKIDFEWKNWCLERIHLKFQVDDDVAVDDDNFVDDDVNISTNSEGWKNSRFVAKL